MASISQVSIALQSVLTNVANTAARTSGFIRRQRQLSGAGFVQALVFGFLANPTATLTHLTQSAANVGVTLSPQGLAQRFTQAAAACLQAVLEAAVQQVVTAKPVAIPILQRFTGVYVLDSTTITLPDALAPVWRGCGGSSAGTAAALKLQVLWNLTTGAFHHIGLQDGRASDQRAAAQDIPLPSGALRIADLGYFALDQIATLRAHGSYVLSRWYPQTALFDLCGQPLDLLTVLRSEACPVLDREVLVGTSHRLPVRLLARQVPQEIADQRRRRIRREARDKGRPISRQALALVDWTICVTTASAAQLSVAEALVLLRMRWQIELLFKLWKSHGRVDEARSQQPWRVLCEVYAKLISVIVLHWVVLVRCWQYPNRSLPKVAQLVQGHALALGAAVATTTAQVKTCLTRIASCLTTGCRMNTRKTHPNTYQLLLGLDEEALT